MAEFAGAVAAFWRDLGPYQEHVTLIGMSEFGRRLKSNESGGTDHGHGNAMFMLGGTVRGGRMHGRWPGLNNEALDVGADLAITTDYRDVLAEALAGPMGMADLAAIFPSHQRKPEVAVSFVHAFLWSVPKSHAVRFAISGDPS